MNTLPPKTRYFFRHNYFETASSRYTMKKNRIPRPLIRFIIRDYPKTDFPRDSCNRTALCYLQAELNEPTASFLSSGNSFTSYLRKVSTERKKEKKKRKKKEKKRGKLLDKRRKQNYAGLETIVELFTASRKWLVRRIVKSGSGGSSVLDRVIRTYRTLKESCVVIENFANIYSNVE